MDRKTWFERELLPAMKEYGTFGTKNFKVLKCEATSNAKGDDHFTSDTLFISLQLHFEDGATETYDMVLKLALTDESFRDYMETEVMFHNEIDMYTKSIPSMMNFLSTRSKVSPDDYDVFPKFYYATNEKPKEVVAIQDLRPLGFRVCAERVILDYDHCYVLMKALGRFHAISYGMKKLNPSLYNSMVSTVKDLNYGDGEFFKITIGLTVDYLEKTKGLDADTLNRFKELVKDPLKFMTYSITPKEPMSVLCHGDFCRNNVLFKYENDKPCDAKFFDFQMLKHSSPAIDLTFFCYLNTTSEFRAKHWDQLMQVYHNSIIKSLMEILECPEEDLQEEFSLEVFRKEFRDYALYGFAVCNFFLPEMMAKPGEQIDHDALAGKPWSVVAEAYSKLRTEEVCQITADIVKDMAKIGAI